MRKQIVTRFAPSPTGYLHVGGARTAFYNWLYARHNDGKFILRIEDTDQARSTAESVDGIIESLKWLGIDWDEGPYYQSDRLDIYQKHIADLFAKGAIYPAFETREELEASRQKAIQEKRNPIYDRSSLHLPWGELLQRMDSGHSFVWRFKVPDGGHTKIPERLMGGDNLIANDSIGDFIITRPGTKNNPGMPLYNFVCAIDDALMGVSHVIRGVEHLPNTPKQVLLYNAMGYDVPDFVHLPIVMKNGKKMSKREAETDPRFPVSVTGRRDLGYLPDATLNHLVLLAWSSPDSKEILSRTEMVRSFDIARLNRANPNFDEEKYRYFNGHYISSMPDSELLTIVRPYLRDAGYNVDALNETILKKMVATERGRCKILSEFPVALAFFFKAPEVYDAAGITKFFSNDAVPVAAILDSAIGHLKGIDAFTEENINVALHHAVTDSGVSFKVAGPVIRMALTGRMQSPGLAEMIDILGMDESCRRLRAAKGITGRNPPSVPAMRGGQQAVKVRI